MGWARFNQTPIVCLQNFAAGTSAVFRVATIVANCRQDAPRSYELLIISHPFPLYYARRTHAALLLEWRQTLVAVFTVSAVSGCITQRLGQAEGFEDSVRVLNLLYSAEDVPQHTCANALADTCLDRLNRRLKDSIVGL